MTPAEQVAQNAAISTLVGHAILILFAIVEGYIIMRIHKTNQRQQEEIDACRLIISGMDGKVDTMNDKLDAALQIKEVD